MCIEKFFFSSFIKNYQELVVERTAAVFPFVWDSVVNYINSQMLISVACPSEINESVNNGVHINQVNWI